MVGWLLDVYTVCVKHCHGVKRESVIKVHTFICLQFSINVVNPGGDLLQNIKTHSKVVQIHLFWTRRVFCHFSLTSSFSLSPAGTLDIKGGASEADSSGNWSQQGAFFVPIMLKNQGWRVPLLPPSPLTAMPSGSTQVCGRKRKLISRRLCHVLPVLLLRNKTGRLSFFVAFFWKRPGFAQHCFTTGSVHLLEQGSGSLRIRGHARCRTTPLLC